MEGSAILIRETYMLDDIGQHIPIEEAFEILCHIESIGQREFFSAGQNGINSDLKIVTQSVNYNNESVIEYNNERYGIYRTYRVNNSDEIELYCEWKGGISG
jgi:SPP1 family predicted phage head-tail adaptor